MSTHSTGKSICPFEINPIIPIQPNEQPFTQHNDSNQQHLQPGSSNSSGIFNLTAEMLEKVLKYMQEDVSYFFIINICIINVDMANKYILF